MYMDTPLVNNALMSSKITHGSHYYHTDKQINRVYVVLFLLTLHGGVTVQPMQGITL